MACLSWLQPSINYIELTKIKYFRKFNKTAKNLNFGGKKLLIIRSFEQLENILPSLIKRSNFPQI